MHPDLSAITVSEDTPIVDALRAFDAAAGRILFVTDSSGALAGVLTDGDVRRHILAGKPLAGAVADTMKRGPKLVREGYDRDEVRTLFLDTQVHCLPVVDDCDRPVAALWWDDVFDTPKAPRRKVDVPVAIMAGGKGTRLEPFTRILPKPLMPVGDHPVLQVIMDRFFEQGCHRFHISLNFKANLIRAYFSDGAMPYDLEFYQEDEPLGTAGSLGLMREALDDTFILANCDTIVDVEFADIVEQHRLSGNAITIIASMKHVVLPYGVCHVEAGGQLDHIQEKPRYDLLAATGIYVIEPHALEGLSASGATDAPDLISAAREAGKRVGVYPIPESAWLDIGQLEELQHTLDRLGVR